MGNGSGEVELRLKLVKMIARGDPEYQRMMAQGIRLEQAYEEALQGLDKAGQDTVWRFLFHCEAMSLRELEIACENLKFQEEIK